MTIKEYIFLNIQKIADEQLVQFLERNVIGTPGKSMCYQHTTVRKKIQRIASPYFANLLWHDKVIATCCFCKRSIENNGKALTAFYIRYLSFDETFRRKHVSERSLDRTSLLRGEIHRLLSGHDLGLDLSEKFFYYAYVDPRNLRSVRLCREFGFEPVRQMTALTFSRINPRDNKSIRIVEATGSEEAIIKKMLSSLYHQHTMFSKENLTNAYPYYIIKDDHGNIIAGAQANPDQWNIHSLPGITGKMIKNVFPYVPYLGRLFNKRYRFIAVEGILYTPGNEKHLQVLLENLLAHHQMNTALMFVDTNSNLYRILKSLDLGLVNRLNPEVVTHVICKFVNYTESEKNVFRSNPAYISGIDVT